MPTLLLDDRPLTSLIRHCQISTWEELVAYVHHLPYGRTSDPTDLGLVLRERKGTCSTKHALLKKAADENGLEAVELILGMYRMTESNTPG
ncbi:MAG: hypothetical protein AAGF87_15415, partial [Bacteroidota bacterium]